MPTVTEGDCMVSLADKLGMQDYHTLYDDAVNAELKKTRPNPNQLAVGDEVQEPKDKGKAFDKAVDKTHVFVVKAKKLPKLRIVLVDSDDKPLAGKAWKLTAPKAASGTTKKDGLIEVTDFPPQDKAGTLEVTWQVTKAKPAAAAPAEPAITKPVYPRPIKASEFTEDAIPAPTAANDVMQYTLKIGSLGPIDLDSGVRARLHNLGYNVAPYSDATPTKKAVEAFQRGRLGQKTPSGVIADVRGKVRDKHDKP
ncbi:MAG: hypothetical protein JST93_05950 [Acidobacteria bacterium]|nr:hypothetical protein [Acidobacteriota bacterium]